MLHFYYSRRHTKSNENNILKIIRLRLKNNKYVSGKKLLWIKDSIKKFDVFI